MELLVPSLAGLLWAAWLWLWVLWLPGWWLTRALVPHADVAERHTLALVAAFAPVPLTWFLIAVALTRPITADLVLVLATTVHVLAVAIAWARGWRPRPFPPSMWTGPAARTVLAVLATFAACAALVVLGTRAMAADDVLNTIQHCLYVIVLHAIGNGGQDALPLYDGSSHDHLNILVHHGTDKFNGLANLFREQRLGNVAILAPFVALTGSLGWAAATVHAAVVTGCCSFLAAREAGARLSTSVVAAATLVWVEQVFLGYYVNENSFAVALVAFLLWTAVRKEQSLGWLVLAGFVAGHLIGVRHTSALFLPAALAGALRRPMSRVEGWRDIGVAAVCTVLAALPWLYVNFIMLGNPFDHPKLHGGEDGRVVTNAFLGMHFRFKALNWPFTDQVVRAPWNAFPSLLQLPLWSAQCFGLVPLGLSAAAVWIHQRHARRAVLLCLAFAVPHSLAIGWIEFLDWEQFTYFAPGLVPLAVLVALGLDGLVAEPRRRAAATALAGTAALVGWLVFVFVAVSIEVPTDPRTVRRADWPQPPAPDAGTLALARSLAAPSWLPRTPVLQANAPGFFLHTAAGLITRKKPAELNGLPLYPSSTVAILSGYAEPKTRNYAFALEGRPLRRPSEAVRTALSLHLVTLHLPAATAHVHVSRLDADYAINVQPIGASAGGAELDFSFWLSTWEPPLQGLTLTVAGQPPTGLRILTHAEAGRHSNQLVIATNYAPAIIDTVPVELTVDPRGEPALCGMLLFVGGVDPQKIQAFSLAGGHQLQWRGGRSQTIILPRNLAARQLVLFSDPYCSNHVPQYGDRFGLATGPFDGSKPVLVALDHMWLPDGAVTLGDPPR